MKSRVIVAAVIEKDGKILFGKKKENIGPYPNTWHLPGGGVKLGEESLDEALIREVNEETGLDVEIISRISFDDGYEPDKNGEMTHYVFLVTLVKPVSNTLKAADDIVEVKWLEKSKIKDIHLPNPTVKVFKILGWI